MKHRLTSSSVYSLLWLLLLLPLSTTVHGHGKYRSLCSPETVNPDLHCSRFVTTRFDATGRLWLVWFFNGHVYLQYSDNEGKTLSQPVSINTKPEIIDDSGEDRAKIAFGNKGEIYLAWTMKTPRPYTGHIRFVRSLDQGKSFSEPTTINDDEFEAHRFAAMETNSKGEIYLAWLDKRDLFRAKSKNKKYAGSAVYYSRSSDRGKSFSINKKIADHSCECCRVAMGMDKKGLPIVLWRHVFPGSKRDHAVSHFISEDSPGEMIRLSRDEWAIDACPHHGPDIEVDQQGNTHVVWFANSHKRQGLSYAKLLNGKDKFTQPTSFGDRQTAGHPYLLSHQNNLYLVWMEFNNDQMELYLKTSPDNGENWKQKEMVAKTAGAADHPFLLNKCDRIYVSWHTRKDGLIFKKIDP